MIRTSRLSNFACIFQVAHSLLCGPCAHLHTAHDFEQRQHLESRASSLAGKRDHGWRKLVCRRRCCFNGGWAGCSESHGGSHRGWVRYYRAKWQVTRLRPNRRLENNQLINDRSWRHEKVWWRRTKPGGSGQHRTVPAIPRVQLEGEHLTYAVRKRWTATNASPWNADSAQTVRFLSP